MYLSPVVRRVKKQPTPGEEITLRITVSIDEQEDPDQYDHIKTKIRNSGGTIEEELQFSALRVTITEEQLENLCTIDDLQAIETTNVFSSGDAGEDVIQD